MEFHQCSSLKENGKVKHPHFFQPISKLGSDCLHPTFVQTVRGITEWRSLAATPLLHFADSPPSLNPSPESIALIRRFQSNIFSSFFSLCLFFKMLFEYFIRSFVFDFNCYLTNRHKLLVAEEGWQNIDHLIFWWYNSWGSFWNNSKRRQWNCLRIQETERWFSQRILGKLALQLEMPSLWSILVKSKDTVVRWLSQTFFIRSLMDFQNQCESNYKICGFTSKRRE